MRQVHDGKLARVQNDVDDTEPFPVTSGVKQGCILAPTLFSMMFSAMLTDAFQDCDDDFPVRYRLDDKPFNLSRLQAKSMVQTKVFDELFYVDTIEKNASTERKMHEAMDRSSQVCDQVL